MAISKIQYKSSASATPEVWMDVTGKTVTAGAMRNGVTALKNDGTDVTGNIPDMTLPSASSSTSSGTAKATITPTSSAQYLNIPAGYLDTAQYYTIAAASGGASNLVTGTFKGTTTGAAMDVTIPYTGNGYPIVVAIEPTGGFRGNSTFSAAIQRYATSTFLACKGNLNTSPTYSDTDENNSAQVFVGYKSSTTSATQYSTQGGANTNLYRDQSSSSTATSNVKIKSKTTMSVFIASNSYGFMANVEYTYHIIYSS